MLQYYRNHPGHNKIKYDQSNNKWIDVDCIISIISMSYNEVYTLDRIDAEELESLWPREMDKIHVQGMAQYSKL